jgi:hypothetical protein
MSNPSAEVKCRHCGEVILAVCGENFYRHAERLMIRCANGEHFAEPPIRTVLSAEDRDELQYILSQMRCFKMWSEVDMLERVLANAGGAE